MKFIELFESNTAFTKAITNFLKKETKQKFTYMSKGFEYSDEIFNFSYEGKDYRIYTNDSDFGKPVFDFEEV